MGPGTSPIGAVKGFSLSGDYARQTLPRVVASTELKAGSSQAGHSWTLEEVYRQHAQSVARWAHRLGGPSVGVEDVVQDVFVSAHRALPGFRGESNVSTWLFRITENVIRQKRRRDKWIRFLGGTAEQVAGHLAAPDRSPVEDLEHRQSRERVYRVLDRMSDRYRSVLVLFELEQLSGEQIAELKGAKLSTVWVWLHRARAEFLRISNELWPEDAP